MPRTYVDRVGGRPVQGTAISASAGVGDANKIIGTGNDGKIDPTLLPDGIGSDVQIFTASESISAGALVNIHAGGVRNADATSAGREAHGFVKVAIANAASGQVFFDGQITGLTGLTAGTRHFMSETAGEITATPVTGTGKIDQCVGFAISATELSFSLEEPVTLA